MEDCVFAAQALSRPPYSMIDPDRIVIRGSSAGGFTVLRALCDSRFSTAFAAGASLYGISNLLKLVGHTHKYESGYAEGLMGGTPHDIPEVYLERSPISQATRIVQPLLVSEATNTMAFVTKCHAGICDASDSARISRQNCAKGAVRDHCREHPESQWLRQI